MLPDAAERKALAMFSLFDDHSANNGEAEGERLRDEALALLRARRAALIRKLQAALRVALDRGEVCADDVRALVPIPAGISPKVNGAALRELAEAGILTNSGTSRRSRRPEAHARSLPVWRLADAADAAAWLATHPSLPTN